MTLEDVNRMLAVLTRAWPHMTLQPGTAEVWHAALGDLPNDAANRGVLRLIRESPRPPSPADIRRAARETAPEFPAYRQLEPPPPAADRNVTRRGLAKALAALDDAGVPRGSTAERVLGQVAKAGAV